MAQRRSLSTTKPFGRVGHPSFVNHQKYGAGVVNVSVFGTAPVYARRRIGAPGIVSPVIHQGVFNHGTLFTIRYRKIPNDGRMSRGGGATGPGASAIRRGDDRHRRTCKCSCDQDACARTIGWKGLRRYRVCGLDKSESWVQATRSSPDQEKGNGSNPE